MPRGAAYPLEHTGGVARSTAAGVVGAMAQKRGMVCMLVAACLSLRQSPLHVQAQALGDVSNSGKRSRVNFYDAKCSACNTVAMELEFALKAEQKKHNGGLDFGVDLRSRMDSKGERLDHDTEHRQCMPPMPMPPPPMHAANACRQCMPPTMPRQRQRRCRRRRRGHLLDRRYSRCHLGRRRCGQLDSRVGKVINYAISELRSIELLEGLCMNMDDYKLSKTKAGVPTYIKVNNHGGSFTVEGTMTLGGDQSSVDSVKLHRLVVGEHTATTFQYFLLLPVASSVSCACLYALYTRSSKLPPSPAVSRCLPMPTTGLSLLPDHNPQLLRPSVGAVRGRLRGGGQEHRPRAYIGPRQESVRREGEGNHFCPALPPFLDLSRFPPTSPGSPQPPPTSYGTRASPPLSQPPQISPRDSRHIPVMPP